MELRDVLAYFAYKYNGEHAKIIEAIEQKEPVSKEQMNLLYKKLDYNFFTIIDDNYPEILKHLDEPPIVMFYKGDMDLIHPSNEIIAKQSDEGVRMIHAYETKFTNKGIELNCVMACECHDDMDILLNQMERAQDGLQKMLTVYQARNVKEKSFER